MFTWNLKVPRPRPGHSPLQSTPRSRALPVLGHSPFSWQRTAALPNSLASNWSATKLLGQPNSAGDGVEGVAVGVWWGAEGDSDIGESGEFEVTGH
jgi:hypothetical protein